MSGCESQQDVWAHELAAAAAGLATLETPATIVAADVSDPYILVLLSTGAAALLVAEAGGGGRVGPSSDPAQGAAAAAVLAGQRGPGALPAAAAVAAAAPITAASLHYDSSGWLGRAATPTAPPHPDSSGADTPLATPSPSGTSGGHYCVLARQGGSLEIYELPTWRQLFASDALLEAPPLLLPGARAPPLPQPAPAAAGAAAAAVAVEEVRLESFGAVGAGRLDPGAARSPGAPACEAPVLLTLASDHTLLAYQAFIAAGPNSSGSSSIYGSGGGGNSSTGSGGGSLRFRRLPLDLPPLLPPAGAEAAGAQPQQQQRWRRQRIVRFDGLGEEAPHSGVFLSGAHPYWLLATRGGLVSHPHLLPPGVAASGLTPFHNPNCPHGFITVCCEWWGAACGLTGTPAAFCGVVLPASRAGPAQRIGWI